MPANISTVRAREALKPRHEPYFAKIETGQYLGFQKLTPSSTGNWVARSRDPDTGKQTKRALGDFAHLQPSDRFDAARQAAAAWFAHLGRGGSTEVTTVRKACENYVAHLRAERGERVAHDFEMRFKRLVNPSKALADTELAKLTKAKVEQWRQQMSKTPAKVRRDKRDTPLTRPRAPGTINRDMTALRAALNYAHDNGLVTTDQAWRATLRAVPGADRRRSVYLDKAQRSKLIAEAAADLAAYLRGLSLVPLRPGALAALTAGDFDKRLRVLTIGRDKHGADRRITLPETTAEFFAEQARNKLPAAPLFARADGKPWDKDAWKKPLKVAATAAKLPPTVTAYTLRHSVITDLIGAGLDVLTVARLSGTSIAMIERHYGHLRAEHAVQALSSLAL